MSATTGSPLEALVRSLAAIQLSQKHEQQQPQHRTPENWRRHTDTLIQVALGCCESFVAPEEAVQATPHTGVTAVSINPELIFNACEQLLNICMEDAGVDDLAVAARLHRVERIVFNPEAGLFQPKKLAAAAPGRASGEGGSKGKRKGQQALRFQFSPNQTLKLKALARSASDVAESMDDDAAASSAAAAAASSSNDDADDEGNKQQKHTDGGAMLSPSSSVPPLPSSVPSSVQSQSPPSPPPPPPPPPSWSPFSREVSALLAKLCRARFEELVAPKQRLDAIEQVRRDVLERLRCNYRFEKEFRANKRGGGGGGGSGNESSSGGGVHIFGSSQALLAGPNSDVDLCLRLPLHGREMAQKKRSHEAAKSFRIALECRYPCCVEVALRLGKAEEKRARLRVEQPARQAKVRDREKQVLAAEKVLAEAIAADHSAPAAVVAAATAAASAAAGASNHGQQTKEAASSSSSSSSSSRSALAVKKAKQALTNEKGALKDAHEKLSNNADLCEALAASCESLKSAEASSALEVDRAAIAATAAEKEGGGGSSGGSGVARGGGETAALFGTFGKFAEAWSVSKRADKKAQEEVADCGMIVFAVASTLQAPRPNHNAGGGRPPPALMAPWPKHGFQVVSRARVPVVKASSKVHPSGVPFDVVVNNDLALRNSSLLAAYARLDDRARALIFLVKAWAKARGLNDAPNGTPSSYCHALLVVFFLTHSRREIDAMTNTNFEHPKSSGKHAEEPTTAPVLPNLQVLHRSRVGQRHGRGGGGGGGGDRDGMVDGLDTSFCEDVGEARESLTVVGTSADARGVPELLLAYFEWLEWLLRPSTVQQRCVSLRLGQVLRGKRALWRSAKLWRLSVEDPFEAFDSERPHDLGQVLTPQGQQKLTKECALAVARLKRATKLGRSSPSSAQGRQQLEEQQQQQQQEQGKEGGGQQQQQHEEQEQKGQEELTAALLGWSEVLGLPAAKLPTLVAGAATGRVASNGKGDSGDNTATPGTVGRKAQAAPRTATAATKRDQSAAGDKHERPEEATTSTTPVTATTNRVQSPSSATLAAADGASSTSRSTFSSSSLSPSSSVMARLGPLSPRTSTATQTPSASSAHSDAPTAAATTTAEAGSASAAMPMMTVQQLEEGVGGAESAAAAAAVVSEFLGICRRCGVTGHKSKECERTKQRSKQKQAEAAATSADTATTTLITTTTAAATSAETASAAANAGVGAGGEKEGTGSGGGESGSGGRKSSGGRVLSRLGPSLQSPAVAKGGTAASGNAAAPAFTPPSTTTSLSTPLKSADGGGGGGSGGGYDYDDVVACLVECLAREVASIKCGGGWKLGQEDEDDDEEEVGPNDKRRRRRRYRNMIERESGGRFPGHSSGGNDNAIVGDGGGSGGKEEGSGEQGVGVAAAVLDELFGADSNDSDDDLRNHDGIVKVPVSSLLSAFEQTFSGHLLTIGADPPLITPPLTPRRGSRHLAAASATTLTGSTLKLAHARRGRTTKVAALLAGLPGVVGTEPASCPGAIDGTKSQQQQQQPKQGGNVSDLSVGGVGFVLLVDSSRDFVRLLADNEEAAAARAAASAAAAAKVKQGSSTSGSVSPFAQVGSKKNPQQPQQLHHRQAQQLSAPPSAAPTPQTQKNSPTHSLPPKPPDAPSTPLSYDDLVGLLVRVLKKGSQKKQWMKLPALKSAFHRETGLHLKPALFATALAASSPPPPPSPPPSLSHLPSAQGGNSGESRLGDVGGADNRGDNSGGVLPVAPSTLPKCNDNDGHPSCPTDLESILDGLLCVRGEPGAHGNSKARWRFVEGAPTPTSTE